MTVAVWRRLARQNGRKALWGTVMDEFVSEPIEPAAGSFDAAGMARGEPGLPGRFAWRGTEYAVAELLRAWKTSTRDRGELYLRRHWFEIRVATGERMTIYC